MKRLLAALLALMMLLTMTSCAAPDAAETDDKLTLVAFNVGKADALLLTSGDTAYLIDTGTEDSWTDLSRALEALGVTHLTGVQSSLPKATLPSTGGTRPGRGRRRSGRSIPW